MNFGIYIKKLFGMDLFEDFVWRNPHIVASPNTDSFVDNTQIIKGDSNCNLILNPDANVEIKGIFQGKIIGLGNNIVRVSGEFDGMISCSKLIVLEGAKLRGKFWTARFIIQNDKNTLIEGDVQVTGELVPFHHEAEKINFDYISSNGINFEKSKTGCPSNGTCSIGK